VPVQAQQLTTTSSTTTYRCGGSCIIDQQKALQPFDSSLGTLTGITLHVDALNQAFYSYFFPNYIPNAQQTGSASFSYSGPFSVLLNGQLYSINIAGSDELSVGPDIIGYGTGTFSAFGSGDISINHSLFDSFIDKSTECGIVGGFQGICVSGGGEVFLSPYDDIIVSSNNLRFSEFPGEVYLQTATYTLTYRYTPHGNGVPEPATWVMMLIGFGAIGRQMRRARRANFAIR
jgi:hypothetical protein